MTSQKKVIVITGAVGGIGQACARALKKHTLIITDFSQISVDKTVETLTKEGFDVKGIACDITDKKDVAKLVDFVSNNGQLKALIHTAGVSENETDLKKIFTVDLVATKILGDAFYKLATENSIAILLSSMLAHTFPANEKYDNALENPEELGAFETISQFVNGNSEIMYNFTKRGVKLLVKKNMDKWVAKGARIVRVLPGVIETLMALKTAQAHPESMALIKQTTPLKRNAEPEDIADVIRLLFNDVARFNMGTDFLVDNGMIHNIVKM